MLSAYYSMPSAANNCLTLLTNVCIEANSVDPDKTAPEEAVCSGSTLFVKKPSKTFQQKTKQTIIFVVIDALWVNSCQPNNLCKQFGPRSSPSLLSLL